MARVGVFVCWCGSNIAKTVDVEKVTEAAAKLPYVVYSTHYKYVCSEPGQNLIKQAIEEHKLDRVVVASCSPRLHEPTFQRCISEAGLNPYMLEMANIREHCSWVHDDKEAATQKAIDLTAMAVAKAARDEPLFQQEIPITKRALVIGGGVAGIQAALDIADAGYPVTLVERTPSIGGRMAQYDKTFPTLDCAACILTPKMVDCASHPNIQIMTYSEVESVSGFVGNFDVTIRRRARSVDMAKCTGCGVCYEKCPVKLPSEFESGMGQRHAIYVPFPQAVPNVPVIDREACRWFKEGKCKVCEKLCTAGAIVYDQEDELINEKFGAIVVATGFQTWDPAEYGNLGYGRYPDVITSLEFERLINASGPTEGKLVRPSDHQPPKKVVFISCIGSRDDEHGYPYCSKVCCMYNAKHALLLREKFHDAQAYVFYTDIRANGKGYEEFVRRAIEKYGAIYIRGRVSRVFEMDGKLIVRGVDTLIGKPIEIEADMVVLASAMEAQPDAKELARKLGISTDEYNWFSEAHPKLRPVEVLTAGIFLAGACQYPKDIPDSVAQASGAASKVTGLFSKPNLLSEPMIAEVDEDTCVGCLLCKEVCPYTAIEAKTIYDNNGNPIKTVASVNEGLCHGCGTCVAACRSSSMQLKGFKDDQLLAEVDALAFAE
ncbi:MAG TPA: CoB--CoM heterodisulfide reductase iron-sulfur subunit A family protein [Armatimonadota bacterium]|nr:CoB--CoM heterodisulfide reductase iron-sulfur subunit A family protein [Armatimonadota bacterium]